MARLLMLIITALLVVWLRKRATIGSPASSKVTTSANLKGNTPPNDEVAGDKGSIQFSGRLRCPNEEMVDGHLSFLHLDTDPPISLKAEQFGFVCAHDAE